MADKDKPTTTSVGKSSKKVRRKAPTKRLKTRFLALEPRVVFDGALAVDIVDKTLAATNPDAAASDASKDPLSAPAAPQVDFSRVAAPADATAAPGDKSAADKTASEKVLGADLPTEPAPGFAGDRSEVVFVDTTVQGYQTLLQQISPSAVVVILDSTRDSVEQMAGFLSQLPAGTVNAVHLIGRDSGGGIGVGSSVLNATSMGTTYVAELE